MSKRRPCSPDTHTAVERFPVADKRSALAALRLRGHTKNPKERKRVIAAAARYAPAAAKAAREADKE